MRYPSDIRRIRAELSSSMTSSFLKAMLDNIVDNKSPYLNEFYHAKKLNVQWDKWIEIEFQHFRLTESFF